MASTSTGPTVDAALEVTGTVPSLLDTALLSGLSPSTQSRTAYAAHVIALWPQFGRTEIDETLTSYFTGQIADFEQDHPTKGKETAVHPELHLDWLLTGSSPSMVGLLIDNVHISEADTVNAWRTVWFDPASGSVVPDAALVNHDATVTAVRAAAAKLQSSDTSVDVAGLGEDPLAAAPVLAFGARGELLVGYDECQLAACSSGRVTLTIAKDATDALLTEAGRAAQASSMSPTPAGTTTVRTPAPSPSPSQQPKVNCRKLKCVALSFDDGPGAYTHQLLRELKAKRAHATFFMLGQQVQLYPHVAREIAEAGNEIGIHTWDHRDLTRLTPAQMDKEIARTVAILRRDAGVTPRYLRPPYGAMNPAVHAAARRAGLALVLWNVDTLDWKTRNTAKTVAAAVGSARRGSIILMHDIQRPTVRAVPAIIDGLRAKGFTLVTVPQLLGKTVPGKKYFAG